MRQFLLISWLWLLNGAMNDAAMRDAAVRQLSSRTPYRRTSNVPSTTSSEINVAVDTMIEFEDRPDGVSNTGPVITQHKIFRHNMVLERSTTGRNIVEFVERALGLSEFTATIQVDLRAGPVRQQIFDDTLVHNRLTTFRKAHPNGGLTVRYCLRECQRCATWIRHPNRLWRAQCGHMVHRMCYRESKLKCPTCQERAACDYPQCQPTGFHAADARQALLFDCGHAFHPRHFPYANTICPLHRRVK